MPVRDRAYVALGSNLGDRLAYLRLGRAALAALSRSRLVRQSAVEETDPFGPVTQGKFLNQMVELETELSPRELLEQVRRIERVAGRRRDVRWGPRTLDLDIVAYERQRASEPDLTVPHPGIRDRDFWKRELADLRGRRGLGFLDAG
jgi:2-amino-4-hydroxy-6-hydroxymethyldihydropteridine diphosphokinase